MKIVKKTKILLEVRDTRQKNLQLLLALSHWLHIASLHYYAYHNFRNCHFY